jgi:phosphoglycerol transferase MdoB-like AlkP superfamily enzyme
MCAATHFDCLRTRIYIPANVRYALTVVGLLLVLNFVMRTVFLLYNSAQATAMSWTDVLIGYSVGLRFDLATIFIFNGIILFFLSLPLAIHRRRRTYSIYNWLLIAANMPILVVNAIDVIYYSFAEKRLTHELFTTASDFGSFKPDLLMEYWWLFGVFFFLTLLMYKLLNFFALRYLNNEILPVSNNRWRWAWSIIFLGMMFMGMHGGLQRKPLTISNAYVGESFFSGSMGLNSAYTILTAVDWENEQIYRIAEKEAVTVTRSMLLESFDGPYIRADYPLLRQASFAEPERHYNVVFLIIESLNARDVGLLTGAHPGQSLTPNLDTLARHARVYRRYFANGTRSVESLPALLNSMPDIFSRPTIGSHFMRNTHYGLPMMLKERGYSSAFFCGSRNGTMGFDKYATVSGIDKYYGMNEYPDAERDFDGYWGCADLPYLQWVAKQQDAMHEPFLSVFFSISNHHPFNLPRNNAEDIAAKPLGKMAKTVMYTDRALGEYFKRVSKEPWYKNTVFVLTGDHCFHEQSDPGRSFMENFHVPLFLIGPGIEPGFDDRIGQHVAVMPTLIQHMRLRTLHASTGVSLFDDAGGTPFAINNLMDVASLAQGDLALSTSFERIQALCRYDEGRWREVLDAREVPLERRLELEYKVRCMFQVLHNVRIANKLHYWRAMPLSQSD